MTEEWRDIKGYEGLYRVSNTGKVLSLHPHSSKQINPTLIIGDMVRGYRRVDLRKNGKRERYLVHRLVAEAFIPRTAGKGEINHIDGDKANNVVGNLEWCDRRENMKHAYACGLVDPHKAIYARWGKTYEQKSHFR